MKITESRANDILHWLDELVEAARLLGVTQAKKLFGCHTDEDRRFERAMYESIDKHRAALLDWEAKQPARHQPAGDGCHCATCTCDPNMTPAVRFDLSPAQQEGAIREHLIRLGWTPPKRRPYNASGSLSEYGVFPECDAQQPAAVEVDANELIGVRARLKSGDYDGADVMKAWLAIDKLLALAAQTEDSDNDR